MSQNNFTCPSCEDQLPVVEFDPCAPDLLYNGIVAMLIARPGEPFANIEDPAEHSTRTDNASSSASAVRRLEGVGSYTVEFGAASKVGTVTIYAKNTGTVNFKIYDNNADNYEFIRSLGCNTKFLVWPIDAQGLVYGGNDGITAVLQGRENITETIDDLKFLEIQGIHTFKNAVPRDNYPLASQLDLIEQ